MVYYGQHSIPFDYFVLAWSNFDRHYNGCCSRWGKDAPRRRFTWWTAFHSGFKTIEILQNFRSEYSLSRTGQPSSRLSLVELLRTGLGRREASDPRDLVYGILGLAQDQAGRGIIADYELSIAQVYANAAYAIMQNDTGLQLLTLNDLGRNPKCEIPSWAPDWSWDCRFCPEPFHSRIYTISTNVQFTARLQNDLCLSVRSKTIGTVSITGPMRTFSWRRPKELVSLLKQWQQIAGVYQTKGFKQPRGHSAAPSPEERTFWRTLFADRWSLPLSQPRRIQDEDISKILAWWTWLQSEAETFIGTEWDSLRQIAHPESHQHITEMFWSSTQTRKLLVFKKEQRIGMGTDGTWSEGRDTSVGDEVHVVSGCPVPLVLRKLGGTKHNCACVKAKVSPKRLQTSNPNAAAANSEPNSGVASSPLHSKFPEDDTMLSTRIATEIDHDGDGIENNAVSEEEKFCYHAPLCDCHHIR